LLTAYANRGAVMSEIITGTPSAVGTPTFYKLSGVPRTSVSPQ
jgi:hypothetical protein